MNNEIGRKITSLTLMTIMLAGGMVIAAPGMVPMAHAANANLFVSAENSQFDNYMSGPQVIEVVVIDSDINETNESKGEPDVTVNGKILRMVQAVDGNWYGYFADRNMAILADITSTGLSPVGTQAIGLDFGEFCSAASGSVATGISTADSSGIAIPATGDGDDGTAAAGGDGTVVGDALVQSLGGITSTCTAPTGADPATLNNVVREAKDVNTSSPSAGGTNPPNVNVNAWPFIQLYPLNPTGNVVVQYNKGGGAQSVTLTFDTVDNFAGVSLDRAVYPQGAQVHATITDLWLNIDPTDEDSWTFGTTGTGNSATATTNYQVFDENGNIAGDGNAAINITGSLDDLMCEDNCVLLTTADLQGKGAVITLQDNDDSVLLVGADAQNPLQWTTASLPANSVPVTITEQGPNSGVFGTYDESDNSAIVITTGASRGTSAAIDYNETAATILVGHSFGSVDIQPTDDEWNSGEEIPVIIADGDINLNSRADEDMDLNNPAIPLIPTLQTGDPFTLAENNADDDAALSVLLDAGLVVGAELITAAGGAGTFVSGETITITQPAVPAATGATGIFTDNIVVNGLIDNGELRIVTSGTGYVSLSATTLTGATDADASAVFTDLNGNGSIDELALTPTGGIRAEALAVEKFSKRAILTDGAPAPVSEIVIDLGATADDLFESVQNTEDGSFNGFNLLNLDVRSFGATGAVTAYLLSSSTGILNGAGTALGTDVSAIPIATAVGKQSFTPFPKGNLDAAELFGITGTDSIGLLLVFAAPVTPSTQAFVADFFSYGFANDGLEAGERVANQIIRIEAEETGDNTGIFEGALEYVMINQLNINDVSTYTGISPIASDPSFIVIEDLTDEDSPRVNYLDLGADGVSTQVADQEEAPSHSGIVSFDLDSYKNADTVVITLQDLDLNVDSDLIDIYTVVTTPGDANLDVVGTSVASGLSFALSNGDQLGRLLDVTFDDQLWTTPAVGACLTSLGNAGVTDTGLGATGFTLVETGSETGVFVGDFQIPAAWCRAGATASESVTGLDIEVNYVDFRDASGEIIEVGDGAGVRANTGSVSLDRTVYPVPFGIPDRFTTSTSTNPDGRSLFPIHQSGMNTAGSVVRAPAGLQAGEFLEKGGLTVHVRVNDPDFDISASGEDSINANTASKATGPVKLSVIRGASTVVLGYAGGPAAIAGVMDVGNNAVSAGGSLFSDLNGDGVRTAAGIDGILGNTDDEQLIRQFGPINEIAPDAGIFESDILIRYTDGPASSTCPVTSDFVPINGKSAAGTNLSTDRFDTTSSTGTNYCILQGDILQVEYTDPADASGDVNTVTDSATFDLRNGVLQSDKSVYIIGSDMILTLIEPDLDLDNDQAETYDLDLIEWDSDAATVTMGDADGSGGAFDPEPLNFRETGDSTGIFQIVIEIPQELEGDNLERGEEIVLEYTDWGPSGADYVGNEDEDVNLTIFTSNFGATVELDQKVYTWTDKVYITIVAPDHNFDGNLVDEIGNTASDPIKVSTRGFDIDNYKLVETGTDTGIFTGEVILTGFTHDADGVTGSDTNPRTEGSGPTDGYLQTDDDDGLTVSFEFSEDETVVGSSLIRWNIGEVQWLEASYPASGTGVIRVIDPDMNLDPEAVDNFDVDVWSDSDAGGIDLTVTETNEATGIFEGTVFFTVTDESSGHRLRVAEGDTVTAEYEDNTLPDPYTTADELDITATSLIGTVVPPLERAPAANLRTVDAFGNSLDTVSVDQQVQISADLANGQDREQSFAYLVQIQDGNGVTVSLAWITGSLSAGQSFSPALSWIPTQAGTYTATAFVWESVDNPTALSPPVSTTVTVQ